MPFKCFDCGHVFDDGEQEVWCEDMGEYFGYHCTKKVSGCPKCGGQYEEAIPCQVCGLDFLEEELNSFVCDSCIENYQNDIDVCYKIGAEDTEKVELNCFLAFMFEKEEIEELLLEKLKERKEDMKERIQEGCEKFVYSDRSWFAERLLEHLERSKK